MVPLGKEKEVDAIKAEFGKLFFIEIRYVRRIDRYIKCVDILTGEKLVIGHFVHPAGKKGVGGVIIISARFAFLENMKI